MEIIEVWQAQAAAALRSEQILTYIYINPFKYLLYFHVPSSLSELSTHQPPQIHSHRLAWHPEVEPISAIRGIGRIFFPEYEAANIRETKTENHFGPSSTSSDVTFIDWTNRKVGNVMEYNRMKFKSHVVHQTGFVRFSWRPLNMS